MATILKTKSVYFNDVNLLPGIGRVRSRKNIPKELHRIIVSPMVSVVGQEFIIAAAKCGLSVTIPRFLSFSTKTNLYETFEYYKTNENQLCFYSTGVNDIDEEVPFVKNILIDIAHGTVPQLKEKLQSIQDTRPIRGEYAKIQNLMVGNVVGGGQLNWLYACTFYFCQNAFIRVGIGNGSPCSTTDETGIGRGQITELIECYERREKDGKKCKEKISIISDGGISKPGFAAKAFAAGADYVLMGGYFSKAKEAESNITGDGTYFGCASEKQNKLAGLNKHSEGKINPIDEDLKPLEEIVSQLWGGISSAISYMGYQSLTEMIGNGVFEIKENSLPPKKRY